MELTGTTTLLVALKAEAQPLIDHYKLKSAQQHPFPIYANEQLKIVITAIGKCSSAAALAHTAAFFSILPNHIWINFGIAGHKDHAIGTAASVSKVISKSNQQTWYPNLIKLPNTLVKPLTTYDTVVDDYVDDTLCDMEAAGFMSAGSSLHIKSECLFVFKIISDTKLANAKNITKNLVAGLVKAHIPTLEALIKKEEMRAQDARNFELEIGSELFEKWHFSQTQKSQLREGIRRFRALDKQTLWQDMELDNCATAKDVIENLNRRLQKLLPKF